MVIARAMVFQQSGGGEVVNLRLVRNQVHLKPFPLPSITASGLHLPPPDPQDCRTFKVLAVGPKVKEIEAGDNVMAPLYYSHYTMEDGTKLVDASQIQMVVRDA